MVYVIERLEDLLDIVRFCRYVLYREYKLDDEVELRIKAGKIGWVGRFNSKDPEYKRIMNWLELNAIRVRETVGDENFFA